MFIFRVKTLSAQYCYWRNPRKKNRARSNLKSASVSALTGSVPRKMAEVLQRVSALSENQTQVALLTATHLNQWAMNSCQSKKKNSILLHVFRNLQPLVCVQDCHSQIAKVGFQGQARDTRIPGTPCGVGTRSLVTLAGGWMNKMSLNTNFWLIHLIAFSIDWSWNIFTSHNFC